MNNNLTLVEGGPAQQFRGADSDLRELQIRSSELVSRLGLREEPFQIDLEQRTVAVRNVAGFISLGEATLEIIPRVLRHDPGWRMSLLTMLTEIHRLEWEPIADRSTRHANLPSMLGLILAEAMGRAAGEGVPRNYVETSGVRQSIRGQIDASKAWRRIVDPYVVDCKFSDFVANHPVAAALAWACGELSEAVSEEWLSTELRNYIGLFPEAGHTLPPPAVMESMQLSPQYGFLHDALDIARLLSMGPQVGTSPRPGAAERIFLWNTDRLFAEFAHTVIEEAVRNAGASSYRENRGSSNGQVRSIRAKEEALADVVITGTEDVVAVAISAHEYDETTFDPIAHNLLAAGRRLGSKDVAILFPASMSLRPGSQWRLRDVDGPNMIHAVMLDPSGAGEMGGMERIAGDLQMDLGGVLAVSRRRGASLANRFSVGYGA